MENRDRDKMEGKIDRDISQNQSKSDTSASFGQNIGRSENKLNEPSSRVSGSVGSSGMQGSSSGQKPVGWQSESNLKEKSNKDDIALGEEAIGRGSQGGSRH